MKVLQSKDARRQSIIDAYCIKFRRTTFSTNDVAAWAEKHRLFPVPANVEHSALMEWNRRFARAVAAIECPPAPTQGAPA